MPQHENVDGTYQRSHTQKSPFDSLSAISSTFLFLSPSRHVQSRAKVNRPRSTNCVHRARNLSLYRTGYKKDFFASLPSAIIQLYFNVRDTTCHYLRINNRYNTRYLQRVNASTQQRSNSRSPCDSQQDPKRSFPPQMIALYLHLLGAVLCTIFWHIRAPVATTSHLT